MNGTSHHCRVFAFLTLAATGWAQAPGYLLNDFDSAAARDIPYFAVEARLRVAALTRFDRPEIARKFAESAARIGVRPCGSACYYSLLTLADFDIDAAEAAAALNEPEAAYPVLTRQAVYNNDSIRFVRLLHDAYQRGLYRSTSIGPAIERWQNDREIMARIFKYLTDGFSPNRLLLPRFLLDAVTSAGPAKLDPDLLRQAAALVREAVIRPAFNQPDSWPIQTAFVVHGRIVTTYSLAESAYFRALAIAAALEGLPEDDRTLPTWAHLLAGLKIKELGAAITPTAVQAQPPIPPRVAAESWQPQLEDLLELAGHGDLTPQQFTQILESASASLPNLEEESRLAYAGRLYHTSLKWPAVPERDMVTALYVSEVQRVASLQSPFASRLRESKDLIRRLDSVVTRLGRVPSKWPACLRENSSLLVRHFLHEVEQASSNLVIDASFPITGGSEMALRDLRRRLVVIAFWRTDCSGCQPLREAINRINQPTGRGGRWIFAVSDQPEADVLATLDDNPFWASIAVDSSARLARTFGIRNVPTVIVVDRAGRLAARIEAEWNAETAAFDFPLDVLQRALAAAGQ